GGRVGRKENERRRGSCRLGRVEEPRSVAANRWRWCALGSGEEHAVQLARRDPLAALAPDVDRLFEHPTDTLSGLRADRHDRRKVEEWHLGPDPFGVLVEGAICLVLHEIPFVDRDDEALSLLDDVTRDVS